MTAPKTTRRAPRSCTECARRKVKCQKEYPCEACKRRGEPHKCVVSDPCPPNEVEGERLLLQDRLQLMERCSNTSGPRDSPEDLLVLLESLSHGGGSTTSESRDSIGIHRLYQPVQQVALMILPERFASEALISFSLQHLSWLHCGIRTMQFWREHQGFWDCVEHGDLGCLKRHDWMALYLSILVTAYLYMDADQRPPLQQLTHLQNENESTLPVARTWYEAALDELDASRPLTHPNLRTVQTVAVLTLCHSHFGQTEREYLLVGMAVNTARCLNMHLLGSEPNFPPHLRRRPEWSAVEDRQMGRRLWWTLVVCDWLGMLSRPSSISLTSFNTSLEPSECDESLLFLDEAADIPASSSLSPLWHLQVTSRLALIIYSNIKAPRDLDVSKLCRAVEQIEEILLQVSRQPPTRDSTPWFRNQHSLALYTIHFLRLTVARAVLVRWLKDSSQSHSTIPKGVHAALEILRMGEQGTPLSLVRRSWIVSAATLAAGIFLAVHLICFKSSFTADLIRTRRDVIEGSVQTLEKLNPLSPSFSTHGAHRLAQLLAEEKQCPSSDHINKEALVRILQEVELGHSGASQHHQSVSTYNHDDTDILSTDNDYYCGEMPFMDMAMGASPGALISDPFMGDSTAGCDGGMELDSGNWAQSPWHDERVFGLLGYSCSLATQTSQKNMQRVNKQVISDAASPDSERFIAVDRDPPVRGEMTGLYRATG